MKFYQLAIGQRFEMDGEVYVKTSPLIAGRESDGTQKLIKRAVSVKLLNESSASDQEEQTASAEASLTQKAINRYYEETLLVLGRYADELNTGQISKLRDAFSGIKEQLLEEFSR